MEQTNTSNYPKFLGYSLPVAFLLTHKLLERICFYGLLIGVRKYFLHILEYDQDTAQSYFQFIGASFWIFAVLGGFLGDEIFGKWKVGAIFGLPFVVGTGLVYYASFNGANVIMWLGLLMWTFCGGMMMPCITSHAGQQVKDHPKGTKLFYNLWFLAIQVGGGLGILGIRYILGSDEKIPKENFETHFLVILFVAALTYFAIFPFQSIAHHSATMKTRFLEAVGVLTGLRSGNTDDEEFSKRVKALRKANFVFVTVFLWGMSNYFPNSFFEDQAALMKQPFEGWTSVCNMLLDGPPQALICIPLITYLRSFFEKRGYVVTHQVQIFIGTLFLISVMGYSAALQMYILNSETLSVNMMLQWPLYLLNAFAETLVYATGLDFAFSVAHESMKSFLLSLFYVMIGFGVMAGGGIFQVFAAYMPFSEGNNSIYQSLVFGGIAVCNSLIFYYCADWTPVKTDDVENGKTDFKMSSESVNKSPRVGDEGESGKSAKSMEP